MGASAFRSRIGCLDLLRLFADESDVKHKDLLAGRGPVCWRRPRRCSKEKRPGKDDRRGL
jgi:hypothetical protein